MKVLFLTNIPSPYRVDFFNELGKLCDLTVLYELEYATNRDEKWKPKKARNFSEKFLKGVKVGSDFALCCSVIKYLNDKTYDVIVIGGYSTPTGMLAIQYLKFRKIPFILNSDGGMIKNDSRIKYMIKKHFISSASAWLSTGNTTTEYLLNYGSKKEGIFKYPFTSIKKEDILKNKLNNREKNKIKQILNINYDKVVISVGRFIESKGFDVLIKASKCIPCNYGIYIIGGKPTEKYIKLIKENNIQNITFINFKSNSELKNYYNIADLFVLPTRGDVWGLVINEAMASGLPIITTDKCIAGLELVKDYENGFIVPVEDFKFLSQKIMTILNDDRLNNTMSNKSLQIIKNYTIENLAVRHKEIFKDYLKIK